MLRCNGTIEIRTGNLRGKYMVNKVLDLLLFVFRVIFFPLTLIATIMNFKISLPFINNGSLLALWDWHCKKKKVVFIDQTGDTKAKDIVKLSDHTFALLDRTKKNKFEVTYVNKSHVALLDDIKNLELAIDAATLPSILAKLDRTHNSNLYQKIILEHGNYPNFVRSDIDAWETLSDLFLDFILIQSADGVDGFLNANRDQVLDQPGEANTFGSEDRFGFSYLSYITERQNAASQIEFQLRRYDQIAGHWGALTVAEKLGDWVYLLHPDSRFYLHSALHNLKFSNEKGDATTLEFFVRNVFYGLLQCADCELHKRITEPFKLYVGDDFEIEEETGFEAEEFFKYMSGNYPPTMAGTARFLELVRKNKKNSENTVIQQFLEFVEQSEYLDSDYLLQKRFAQKLFQMGRLRGSIMHPSKVNYSQCQLTLRYLLDGDLPGEFFYSIGIDKAHSG